MVITYRRTGSALGLVAMALAVTTFTVAVAAIAVVAAGVFAPIALFARAMKPASRRRRTPSTPLWPHETIEAEVVSDTRSSDERDLLRLDSDKG
jgi:hypothetical protein